MNNLSCQWRDSNPGRLICEATALPTVTQLAFSLLIFCQIFVIDHHTFVVYSNSIKTETHTKLNRIGNLDWTQMFSLLLCLKFTNLYLLITILLHYFIPFLFVYNLLLSELRIKFFWELHKFRSADWGLITDLGPETLATPLSTHPQQQQEAKKSPNGQCTKGRIAASGWGTIHLRPFWQEEMWTIFGEILSLIQFLSVCLVLGTILYLFGNKNLIWANYLCCKWPNVEKIIHRSGNCLIDYII